MKILIALTFLFASHFPANARAYDLNDDSVPVVKRSSRPSGTKFKPDESWRTRLQNLGVENDLLGQLTPEMQTRMDWRSARYDNFSKDLPVGSGTYDALPRCQTSQVTRTDVTVESDKLAWFDLLFYDYHDPVQTKRAASWDLPAAPFLEGDLYNPYRSSDRQQDMARLFELRCLPTRFHFVREGSQQYLEYREGERAWDQK